MIKINKFVIRNIKIPLADSTEDYDLLALRYAEKKLSKIYFPYPIAKKSFSIYKKSVDARKKNEIFFVYSISFELCEEVFLSAEKEEKLIYFCQKNSISMIDETRISFEFGKIKPQTRPLVVGFGPCGMFAAYILAKAGFSPIVIERGKDVDARSRDVENYWKNGILSQESNVQFGEGGAGTFSDGKLLTRINDKFCSFVLETFYKNGADVDILFSAKPHVGTDKLREIVKNIRKSIIENGGEVRFNTRLEAINKNSSGKIISVLTNNGEIKTDTVFLAIGHSARDTFLSLLKDDVKIQPKPFSVGVRVEHLQKEIDKALYGEHFENPALPKGEYALSKRIGDRAVYSFCMCPGGTVVASASEDESVVTNGMSYSSRDGVNANSAIAVSVSEKDFGGTVFAAIDFQKNIEIAAYKLAGSKGAAPIQNIGNFLGNTRPEITTVFPTYTGKTELCDINKLFPDYITSMLKMGFLSFENNISGFSSDSAIITAPETRTSSPIRILRDEDFFAYGIKGLYPCGEGAGYAGGITSAAVDGIKTALSYISKYKPI